MASKASKASKWYGRQIDTDALIELKARIREVRLACGLSQGKLAHLAGMDRESAISRIESTATLHWPSLPMLVRLAEALEVNVVDLLPDQWRGVREIAPEGDTEPRPARRGACHEVAPSGAAPI